MAEPKADKAASKLVKMVREAPEGEPTTADVHPDEVSNFRRDGWHLAGAEDGAEGQGD